jgi:hypothetical protein
MLPLSFLSIPALALAALLFAGPVAAQSGTHASHDAHAGHVAPATAPQERWATDAALRAGMHDLREATEALHHYEMGHLDDTQRDNAVKRIDAAIGDMVANCKLKPDADAALHGLLVKFIAGANAARAGRFTKAELGPMEEALATYPQRFDDPEWNRTDGRD